MFIAKYVKIAVLWVALAGLLVVGSLVEAGSLQVEAGSSGATPHSLSKIFVEDNDDCAITIGTPNNKIGYILFADPQNSASGYIGYTHSANQLLFATGTGTGVIHVFMDSNGNLAPVTTKGPDLGAPTNVWDNLYYDDAYNYGALDFSTTSTLDFLRAHPVRPKKSAAFDELKEQFAFCGVYAKELDPGCLPRALTNYYSLLEKYIQHTDPEWVKANIPDVATSATTDKETADKKTEDYIKTFKEKNTHPDNLPSDRLGISTNQMVSWNYTAVRELVLKIDGLKEKIRNLPVLEQRILALEMGIANPSITSSNPSSDTADPSDSLQALIVGDTTIDDEVLRIITDAVLSEIEKGPREEIDFADAWEEVDETIAVEVEKAVTQHQINWETMQVEQVEMVKQTLEFQPTGNTIKKLKKGVYFDENTGKFYR